MEELDKKNNLEESEISDNEGYVDLTSKITTEKHEIIQSILNILHPPSCIIAFVPLKKSKSTKSTTKLMKSKKSKKSKKKSKKSKKKSKKSKKKSTKLMKSTKKSTKKKNK